MMRKSLLGFGTLVISVMCLLMPAFAAEEAYVIGCSMAVTGPGSDTYAPIKEALDIYFKEMNARGGINGHPVKIIIEDDAAQPAKAAAQAKKFVTQDNVILTILASLSSTYAPVVEATRKGEVPLLFAGVCPSEVYPPQVDPNQFCTGAYGAKYDSRFAVPFMRERTGKDLKLGLAAMNVPLSRAEIDFAEELAKGMGIEVVDKEATPPPTPDYTPFATKLKDAGSNWVYAYAPWGMEIRVFESLRKIGWKGNYLAWAHIQAEQDLERLKDDGLYVFGTNAFFADSSPTHKTIKAAAEREKSIYPYMQLPEGWILAMTLEEILKNTPWPATPAKVRAAMNKIQVDTRGIKGAQIVWNERNHFRTVTAYRAYKWDSKKGGVVLAKNWTPLDVK
jgi:branched-chain amino acid transport system substrate-binding protein